MSLYNELNSLTLQGYRKESLASKVKLAGIRTASHLKSDVVDALNKYLSNRENILAIWHDLEPLEQDLIIDFLRCGAIDAFDVRRIYAEHGYEDLFERSFSYYSLYYTNFLPDESKAGLFFIGGGIPKPIQEVLMPFVKPYEPLYSPKESLSQEDHALIIEISDSFETDFIRLLRLINKGKLRVTKVNQFPTKGAVQKMDAVLAVNEWETASGEGIEEVRTVEKTTRIFGLFQLLKASSLICIENGAMALGPNGENFLTMNVVEKCKALLHGYRESRDIVELDRFPEMRLLCDNKVHSAESRGVVIENLKDCPVAQWISLKEFSYTIKKRNRRFLQNAVGEIYVYQGHQNYYSHCHDWSSVNERYIQMVLLEYLAMMGIVDVAVSVDWEEYSQTEYFNVDFFRLTPLGGHVLGVNKNYTYERKVQESGFLIQPNFEIFISEGSMKDAHCLFFDSFAIKVGSHPTPIYKLSFKAIVDSLDYGLQVKDIIDYLTKYSEQPLPQNVLSTLESWAIESERISIRTITVLEAHDPYLIEELKSYKSIDRYILKGVEHAVEIKRDDAKKLKREIEKKGRFCLFDG